MVTHHWDHFINVSHFTCWSLAFLSPLKLNVFFKFFSLHVSLQTRTQWQTALRPSLPTIHTAQCAVIRLPRAIHLPWSLNLISQSDRPRLGVRPFTCTPQKTPQSFVKVSRVHTRVAGPLCLHWIRQADRQPTSDFTTHALNSRAGLQEEGQWSVERPQVVVGSMSPLASCNRNSAGGWARVLPQSAGGS